MAHGESITSDFLVVPDPVLAMAGTLRGRAIAVDPCL